MTEPTYHFIARIPRPDEADAALYGCDKCGAVVEIADFDRHDQWHVESGSSREVAE